MLTQYSSLLKLKHRFKGGQGMSQQIKLLPPLNHIMVCTVFTSLLQCKCCDIFSVLTEPDWASYSLGIFVCLNCSGIHRNLPAVSKVKSIRLDRWEDSLVEVSAHSLYNWDNYIFSSYIRQFYCLFLPVLVTLF